MRTNSLNANLGARLELLEPRLLCAGDVGRLPDGSESAEVAGNPYDPAADVIHAHDTLGLSGFGQTVAIIDSGIAYDHFALGGGLGTSYRVVGGWDFAENDAYPYDDGPVGFHGTHVAGIIGSSAETANGVAPQADLVALRVFDDAGHGQFDWIESALAWVHDHRNSFESPITTVNLSIGGKWNADSVPDWSELEEELANLEAAGILVAVAAGNDFADYDMAGLNYPAASPHVVPVASVGADGQLSSFSQRHGRVLAAPGERINSTVPDYLYSFDGITDDFYRVSGTSMAAPYVAGASVLVREALARTGRGDVSVRELYHHLYETADSIADPITGASYQRVNLSAALESVLDVSPVPMNDVVSLGTVEQATIPMNTPDHWFEFTAVNDGIVVLIGNTDNPVALDDVEVLADWTKTDKYRSNEVLAIPVQRGTSYQLCVPTRGQFSRLSLAQIVSLGNDLLEIHGDQVAGEIVVQIGQSFAVVAGGSREQIGLDGRWVGHFNDVAFAETADGLLVQLPSSVSALDSPARRVPRQGRQLPLAPTSNMRAAWSVVGADMESTLHVQLSPLAADASFAVDADHPTTTHEVSSWPVSLGKPVSVGKTGYYVMDVSHSGLAVAGSLARTPRSWFTLGDQLIDQLFEHSRVPIEHALIDHAMQDRRGVF